jgi:hypothetical protein
MPEPEVRNTDGRETLKLLQTKVVLAKALEMVK